MAKTLITGGIFTLAGFHAGLAASDNTTHHVLMAVGLASLAVFRAWASQRFAR